MRIDGHGSREIKASRKSGHSSIRPLRHAREILHMQQGIGKTGARVVGFGQPQAVLSNPRTNLMQPIGLVIVRTGPQTLPLMKSSSRQQQPKNTVLPLLFPLFKNSKAFTLSKNNVKWSLQFHSCLLQRAPVSRPNHKR